MTSTKQSSISLLFTLFTISFLINNSKAADCVDHGNIAVYWGGIGGEEREGTLQEACATGNYNIVVIDALFLYDSGKTPDITLPGHCSNCTVLEPQIKYCQSQNIKVLISLVIRPFQSTDDSESSKDVAKKYADYLLENFLSDQPGPLGKVTLDGFNFPTVADGSNLHADALVKAINASTTDRKIYLSASPGCEYPDEKLNTAIQTGLFDYIWVAFEGIRNTCTYSRSRTTIESIGKLVNAWNTWTSKVPNSLIFMQLTANSEYDSYIAPFIFNTEILPITKRTPNYGGVMIFYRNYDRKSGYSGYIKHNIKNHCKCVCDDESESASFYGLGSRSLPVSQI